MRVVRRSLSIALIVCLLSVWSMPTSAQTEPAPCFNTHLYLPLIVSGGSDSMIIAGFGATFATAYLFPTLQAEDDWQITRSSVTAKVGGMGGSFDFYGANNYPIESMPVKKSFTLTNSRGPAAGEGTIIAEAPLEVPGSQVVYVLGSSTSWLTTLPIGSIVATAGESIKVLSVEDNTNFTGLYLTVYEAPTFPASYTVQICPTWTGLEAALKQLKAATISLGESKLWGLERGGAHLWAWAKCVGIAPPESYRNKLSMPVSLDFLVREGLWYGENQQSQAITQATTTYTLTNAGDEPACIVFQFTPGTDALTNVVVTNTTNGDTFTYAHSVSVGNLLKVDTGEYSVLNNAVEDFDGLTYGATQANWLRLNPGANTITIAVTGSTAWAGTITWWDTYL